MLCPICKKPVDEEEPSRPLTYPFCSDRCKLIDLGRWLGEKYQLRMPRHESPPDDRHSSDDARPSSSFQDDA
jgi:endogenous inhibitor of DNA gyrase (YacG/DUF329 family)